MDRRLLVLALGMFALGTDSYVVAGVLPQLARSFHVGIGAAGQMTTVYSITFALLAPTIAAIAATVDRKRLMLSGMALFILSNLATAVAPSFEIALLTRVLAGVGAAMFSPTAMGSAASIVPAEQRGFALSVVVAGLSGATALGAPIGAVIGGLSDWRCTMVFVAALATLSSLGVLTYLKHVPLPPAISLSRRVAPVADLRIGLTLATTLLAMAGIFTAYTYFSVVFDRAFGDSAVLLGVLLSAWGIAGTVSNLTSGKLIDSIGSRKVVVIALLALIADFALLPWSSAHAWSSVIAILVWGAAGWGLLVPQQHRLVTMVPSIAPILLGLNTAGTHLGVTTAGLIGAAGIAVVGAHDLGFVAIVPLVLALVASELAGRRIHAAERASQVAATTAVQA